MVLAHDDAVRVQDAVLIQEAAQVLLAVVTASDAAAVFASSDGLLGCNSIDIVGKPPNPTLIMFGVLRRLLSCGSPVR